MSITCNFGKDDRELKKGDKLIVRIPPGQSIGADTPSLKPSGGAYLWVMGPRRRSGKGWRDEISVN